MWHVPQPELVAVHEGYGGEADAVVSARGDLAPGPQGGGARTPEHRLRGWHLAGPWHRGAFLPGNFASRDGVRGDVGPTVGPAACVEVGLVHHVALWIC